MPFQEVVEAQGHLIDSHIMENIFDKVVEYNGRFEVEEFRIGRTNSEPSYLRLKVEADGRRFHAPSVAGSPRVRVRHRRRGRCRAARSGARLLRARGFLLHHQPPYLRPPRRQVDRGRKPAHGRHDRRRRRAAPLAAVCATSARAIALLPDCAASACRRNRKSAIASPSPSCRTASRPSVRWKPRSARRRRWSARPSNGTKGGRRRRSRRGPHRRRRRPGLAHPRADSCTPCSPETRWAFTISRPRYSALRSACGSPTDARKSTVIAITCAPSTRSITPDR